MMAVWNLPSSKIIGDGMHALTMIMGQLVPVVVSSYAHPAQGGWHVLE